MNNSNPQGQSVSQSNMPFERHACYERTHKSLKKVLANRHWKSAILVQSSFYWGRLHPFRLVFKSTWSVTVSFSNIHCAYPINNKDNAARPMSSRRLGSLMLLAVYTCSDSLVLKHVPSPYQMCTELWPYNQCPYINRIIHILVIFFHSSYRYFDSSGIIALLSSSTRNKIVVLSKKTNHSVMTLWQNDSFFSPKHWGHLSVWPDVMSPLFYYFLMFTFDNAIVWRAKQDPLCPHISQNEW